jgi:hypothetical protein
MAKTCCFQVTIPGTKPRQFRDCKHSTVEGQLSCARHGGPSIRPRRQRALLARLRRAWRAFVR